MDAKSAIAVVHSVSETGGIAEAARRLELYGAKALRTACVKLNLRPQSSSNADNCSTKSGLVALLVSYIRDRLDGAAAGALGPSKPTSAETTTRQTKHCAFRLLNVLFSDQFAPRLPEVNAAASRGAIEVGAVNDSAVFWRDVADAFASKDPDLDNLVAQREIYDDIKPGAAVLHNPAKLRKMWQKLSARYTLAYSRAHQSGTHATDFFDFCDGRVDTLYVHDWLRTKPQLLSQVDGRLPKSARVDTLDSDDDDRDTSSSEATPSKRARTAKVPQMSKALERIVQVLERNAERRAPSSLATVRDMARSATQILEMVTALKAAGGDTAVIEDLQHEANELAKQAAAELRNLRHNSTSST